NIPLSLFLGTAIVTLLYIGANVAYILVLPLKGSPEGASVVGRGIQFALSDRVATAASSMIFGAPAVVIMAVLIMISTFGCNNGLILAGARVYYAMAKDNLFFKKTGTVNKNSVPGVALIVQAVWASLLCLSGTYGDLLDYVIFAVLIFYILTIAGIFLLRKKRPDAERPYKAWGYPVVPALYILAASAISIDLLIFKPMYSWPGMIIVLLGIPVYFIWKRFAEKENG
ncbi:MAG TPA: amino acid permease, partial [Ignavibacteriaceae bacterium]|nr:amino acid permease [Ignavibacteriaceae bacterium]